MDLLLWRHAEAVDGSPDHARELTQRGHKQARRMAAWLTENKPKHLRVLVSPTLRTRQTASAFADDFEIVSSLAPDGGVADILAARAGRTQRAALVVGHQRSAVSLPCCYPARKRTGRSRRARCGGSPTGSGTTKPDGLAGRDPRVALRRDGALRRGAEGLLSRW